MALLTLENAIYASLSGGTALTALIGGTASPRIYSLQAPSGAALPYVIFFMVDGRIPNASPRQDADYLYQVEGWGETRASAEAISKAIFDVLDRDSLTVAGWSNFDSKCRGVINTVEMDNGRQYWRHGGEYQFKLVAD